MEILEGFIIGCLILLISTIGFMISVVLELKKIREEQEKITDYIPFDWLKRKN
ncbi:unnamed protein product [marine sediment metagenome]|uniref:Uncharacterized protein n=1 Tax=marine sediment metagenome TaxID=412755 RepID=X0XZA5_9ZZZZ